MTDPTTGEEIVEESGEELTEEEKKAADEAKAAEEAKVAEDAKKAEEEKKEENRKAYELRQKQKGEKPVSRQEFEKLQKDLEQDKEERSNSNFRQTHPDITDEEFNSIKAHSKGSGKSLEETLEDPVFQKYFETQDAKDRSERATPAPSTKTKSGGNQADWDNMPSDEFKKKQEEVLRKQRS